MKKLVTIVLEVESDNENAIKDDGIIIKDLKSQFSCCSNWYDFVSVEIEEVPEDKDKPKPIQRNQ